jgi:hypothetical protein
MDLNSDAERPATKLLRTWRAAVHNAAPNHAASRWTFDTSRIGFGTALGRHVTWQSRALVCTVYPSGWSDPLNSCLLAWHVRANHAASIRSFSRFVEDIYLGKSANGNCFLKNSHSHSTLNLFFFLKVDFWKKRLYITCYNILSILASKLWTKMSLASYRAPVLFNFRVNFFTTRFIWILDTRHLYGLSKVGGANCPIPVYLGKPLNTVSTQIRGLRELHVFIPRRQDEPKLYADTLDTHSLLHIIY